MSLDPNSYGNVAAVEALTRRYAGNGGYSPATRPALMDVENFIDRLSARLNGYLAEAGFTIPIAPSQARLIMDDFVITTAVDYCHWANSAGRFTDSKTLKGRSFTQLIDGEAMEYISEHSKALQALGANRPESLAWGLQTRTEDAQGNPITPMFQQRAFNWNIRDIGT